MIRNTEDVIYDFIIAWNITMTIIRTIAKIVIRQFDNRSSKSYKKNIDDKDAAADNSINDVTKDDTARKK